MLSLGLSFHLLKRLFATVIFVVVVFFSVSLCGRLQLIPPQADLRYRLLTIGYLFLKPEFIWGQAAITAFLDNNSDSLLRLKDCFASLAMTRGHTLVIT